MNTELIIGLLFFILGSLFGSFISVLIHRLLHRQKGIIRGKSRCPKCKHALGALDLVPIFSWLFKGGKCSYCHKPISFIYPALELVCGLLFLTNYNLITTDESFPFFNYYQLDWLFVLKISFICLVTLNMVAIFFSDLQKKSIPNVLLYIWVPLTALAFPLTTGEPLAEIISRLLALAAALLFFGGQYLVSKGKWLGSGDIYVAAGMALLLGLNGFLMAVGFSYLIGCLFALLLLILRQVKFSQTIPFAPFLILGTLIALYHGQAFLSWYLGDLLLI